MNSFLLDAENVTQVKELEVRTMLIPRAEGDSVVIHDKLWILGGRDGVIKDGRSSTGCSISECVF